MKKTRMTSRLEHEPFVDAMTVGNFLQLRRRRVLELAREGVIPAYPLGTGSRRVWRFRLSEVITAIGSSRVNYSRQSPAPTHCDSSLGLSGGRPGLPTCGDWMADRNLCGLLSKFEVDQGKIQVTRRSE